MKRIDININKPNFIGCWNIEDEELCNEIINFFDNNDRLQVQGVTSGGKNLKAKSRIDISINPHDLKNNKFKLFKRYINRLHECYLDYQNQWPFLKNMIKDIDIGKFNIGKYSPGDHFGAIHSERTSINTLHRLFAFMTYLNDVEDGGQTNFDHYGIKLKPEVGKTIIWPAEWTHAHTGEILKSGSKYIITGWMHFPSTNKSEFKI